MFSLSNIIRVYIILSIVVMISFFVMLTSVDIILEPVWGIVSSDIEQIYRNLYITVIIMSLIAIITGIAISIFIFDRGINKYKDLLRRFENIDQSSILRPASLRFPDQDEFGNLGTRLNDFITKIDYYDQLKTNLAKAEQGKFTNVAELLPYPLLLINMNTNEPYISFYNNSFKEHFLKKSVFIDIQGKPKTQYYILEDTPLSYLTLKTEEQEPFFTEQQFAQLKNNLIHQEKKHIIHDGIFSDLVGDKKYIFEQVVGIPIINELEHSVSQMLYIFINGQSIEKEKKNIVDESKIHK
ncbi:MAG: hypothetical protein ACRCWI_04910 [Brevinema sp.]